MAKNQHVVRHRGGWAVKGEGNARATKVYDRQRDAIGRGREISQKQRSEPLIHGRHGVIRKRDSHVHDPNPPKG